MKRDVEQLQEQVRVLVVLGQGGLERLPGAGGVAEFQPHEPSVPAHVVTNLAESN